jgi:hypothetical protein
MFLAPEEVVDGFLAVACDIDPILRSRARLADWHTLSSSGVTSTSKTSSVRRSFGFFSA